jgi:hypothetical protein
MDVSTAGDPADDDIYRHVTMSRDGRFVAFTSSAENLVADDLNGNYDVFVRDRDTDADGVFDEPGAVATVRVNLADDGTEDPFSSRIRAPGCQPTGATSPSSLERTSFRKTTA